jgi:type I restriction enzyme, R subunit
VTSAILTGSLLTKATGRHDRFHYVRSPGAGSADVEARWGPKLALEPNVDKKLGGVNAVQTLSRLNRTHPEKRGAVVLDFANEADAIKAAFEPYYETTLLSEETDPNLLYEIQTRLAAFPVYTEADINGFAQIYYDRKATQDRLHAFLAPMVERWKGFSEEERVQFRGQLNDYVRLYVFLAQVLTFSDVDLEKLYVFARLCQSNLRVVCAAL